jgi:hypothetical protein
MALQAIDPHRRSVFPQLAVASLVKKLQRHRLVEVIELRGPPGHAPFGVKRGEFSVNVGGRLLETIGERNRPETGVMITALVNYLDQNDAGPAYAQRIGFLRKGATADGRLEFWASQIHAVHDHYA